MKQDCGMQSVCGVMLLYTVNISNFYNPVFCNALQDRFSAGYEVAFLRLYSVVVIIIIIIVIISSSSSSSSKSVPL